MNSSVYQEKLYPEVPTAPVSDDDNQTYRLRKIEESERFLRNEITQREQLGKKFKRFAGATMIGGTSVITAITTLEVASVVTLSTGVGLPVSIVLAATGLALGIGSTVVNKSQKIFESKAKKHDKIKVLAEAKLDSISGLVSKVIEDANISHQEYKCVIDEIKHYCKMKEQIRSKSKQAVDTITAEQREKILAQCREEGKEAFLRKIVATSDTQPVNAM